jgi:hypothetical protein
MYGTILDGQFIPAPNTLTDGGMVHYHPPDEMYAEAGYLLKVDTSPPEQTEEDTTIYASRYVEQDGQAVQTWEAVEMVPEEPTPAEPTLEERVQACETEIQELKQTVGV